jgi:hypothetical protein
MYMCSVLSLSSIPEVGPTLLILARESSARKQQNETWHSGETRKVTGHDATLDGAAKYQLDESAIVYDQSGPPLKQYCTHRPRYECTVALKDRRSGGGTPTDWIRNGDRRL